MRDRQLKHFLVICAYRDNEVGPTHPFAALVNRLEGEQVAIGTISLHPLSQQHLCELVADTVGRTSEQVQPLASLVRQKTEGNPFFVNEFLKRLHDETLLHYSPESRQWEWDIERIRAKDLTDNVVDLLIGRLQQLPAAAQEALRLAACIGAQFDLDTLAIASERSRQETFEQLTYAIRMGLVVTLSELNSELTIDRFRFEHDRIQQAAYATIASDRRTAVHLSIGRLLLKQMPPKTLSSRLFEVLDHLNQAIPLILLPDNPDRSELLTLAKLNLRGGKKAKSATAYQAAARYLNTGLELMGEPGWDSEYTLTLALHDEAVEVAYLNHNFDRVEALAAVVERHGRSVLDCVNVSRVQILAKIAHNLHLEAISIGLDILARLGIELPDNSQPNIERELSTVAQLRADTEVRSLLERPCMNAVDKLAAMQVLSELLSSGYQASIGHFILSDLKQIELSIQYGNTAESAFAYDCYGIILCGVTGDIAAGYQFGQLAQAVVEKFGAKHCKSRVVFVFNAFVRHWTDPLNTTISDLHSGFQAGLDTGDVEYACYSLCWEAMHSLLTGKGLRLLAARMREFHETIAELQQSACLLYLRIYQQTVANLLGQADAPSRLNGEFLSEADVIVDSVQNKLAMAFFYVHKCLVSYLLQDYETAYDSARKARDNEDGMIAAATVAQLNFYESLTLLALCDRSQATPPETLATHESTAQELAARTLTIPDPKILLEQVGRNQQQLKQWASHAPGNNQHKFDLVEAERHRVLGHFDRAGEAYDLAISGAKASGYIHEEALANELAATHYLSRHREQFGRVYLQEAYFNYYQWGATEKVQQLECRYPQLVSISAALASGSHLRRQTRGKEAVGEEDNREPAVGGHAISMRATLQSPTTPNVDRVLDLEAVLQASQAISSEIVLDRLLVTLIQILVKSAGAQVGLLLLERDGQFVIEASCNVETQEETVLQSLACCDRLPQSLLNYVQRTQESVVLQDAAQAGNFITDPYVQHHQSKSILCAPLLNQRQLSGILYLENNLTVGAFTPERLEVLQLLSGQAAIAIDQASLYANLEQKVEERTQELSTTLAELRRTQEGLVQSEKMAALGQLVAGIAHEINTPMGAIRSSVQYITNFLDNTLLDQPQFFGTLTPEREQQFKQLLERALDPSTILSGRERRRARKRIAKELETAGVPHHEQLASLLLDINIYGEAEDELEEFLPLFQSQDCIPFVKMVRHWTRVWESTRDIQTAGDRAAKIIFALKTYARHDYREDAAIAQVADGLEAVLTLYHNQIKHGVSVIRNYSDVPPIPCYFDELSQVWTNLIHNALQAMDYRGTLTVGITQVNSCIQVQITDGGSGIPDDVQADIFKPFFTTKPPGEGSGLGLDIVKKIVDKHRGTISFQSVPGNTTFTVQLPISADEGETQQENVD
ncbi:MAG: ATP-binding protein [Cyanobacteria bacterium P01_E01_bin.45]